MNLNDLHRRDIANPITLESLLTKSEYLRSSPSLISFLSKCFEIADRDWRVPGSAEMAYKFDMTERAVKDFKKSLKSHGLWPFFKMQPVVEKKESEYDYMKDRVEAARLAKHKKLGDPIKDSDIEGELPGVVKSKQENCSKI
jgi:hypothetical protein